MNEQFIYHRVPNDMKGKILYPLNRLRDLMPALYKEKVKKYYGREHIMEDIIPILNCKWNDVLHVSAVHPKDITKELKGAGFNPPKQRSFQIDPSLLDPEKTIIYWYRQNHREGKLSKDNFDQFYISKLTKCNIVPKETIDYYQEQYKQGKKPLIFHRIPHILYKGSLDTTELPTIEA